MGWRDRLMAASFRGVAFKVDSHDHELGRRVEVHEYAQRDRPWAEDLGLATRRYRIDAYVIGRDYDQARDALLAALEQPGPGELVHPWLGRRMVCLARPASLREDIREAGQALFSLEFVDAGEAAAPAITPATQAAARSAAQGAKDQAATGLGQGFSTTGVPAFVQDEARGLCDQLADQVEDLTARLAPVGAALDGYRRQLATFRSRVLDLVSAPAQLASSAMALVRQVRTLANTPAAALQALRPLLSFGSTMGAVLGLTPARDRQRANQAAFLALVRRAAAAEAVAAIADMTFESYDAAGAVRDEFADALDVLATEAADAGDDGAWAALVDLRQALIADITARGGSLARLFDYPVAAGAPALVIAYSLYGDAGRDADLVARNRIAHPGFVPGGAILEALTPTEAA